MGFLGDVISGVVKVAITPVAAVKDIVNVATGKEPNATKKLLKSAGKDLNSAGDYMLGEK